MICAAPGHVLIGADFSAIESRGTVTGDTDTTNGSWSAATTVLASASGTDNLRVVTRATLVNDLFPLFRSRP